MDLNINIINWGSLSKMKHNFHVQEKRNILSLLRQHIVPQPHPNRVLDEHYFLYMLEGGWSMGHNGADYEFLPDDVLVLSGREYHYAVHDCLPMTKYIWVLADAAPGDCCSDNPVIGPRYISLDTKISCRGYEAPKRLFYEIALEYLAKNKHSDIKLSSLFNVLLCELLEINTNNATVPSSKLFNNILFSINMNPDKFYSIKEFANAFAVSESTIKNTFIRNTGESVREYQLKRKIEIIKKRLQIEPNVKIKTIAKEFGFCDEFHMSKIFKKYTGISPTEYKFKFIKSQ